MSRYFHRTAEDAAASILRHGFKVSDRSGWLDENGALIPGVWISDVPVPEPFGGAVLTVELPDDIDLAEFEDFDGPAHRRVWYVPLALVNAHARIAKASD